MNSHDLTMGSKLAILIPNTDTCFADKFRYDAYEYFELFECKISGKIEILCESQVYDSISGATKLINLICSSEVIFIPG